MCGIVGACCHESFDDETIQQSLQSIVHRGPDDSGLFRDGSAWLGMRRLSVIDLQGGRQPVFNEAGTVAVVCNGEIYNYRELRQELRRQGHQFRTASDTEVIVHLYETYGERLCDSLRGMFAFALWDTQRGLLLLGRDRFGQKPLYYARTPSGGILFASELKALRPLAWAVGNTWEIAPQAIYHYLSLGCVPQPKTVISGVHALPPASCLRFDGTAAMTKRYWSLDYRHKAAVSYSQALDGVRSHLQEAVQMRLRADVPLGVFLSGGMDSSVVAYEAARQVGGNLHTFTVATADRQLDESAVARRTAEALGVGNTILPLKMAPAAELEAVVSHYDQPFADPSAIPSLAIARMAREHVTVVLNGDGGDEIFAGYRRHLAAHLADFFDRLPFRLNKRIARLFGSGDAGRRSQFGLAARLVRGLALEPLDRYLAWTTDRLRERDKRAIWKTEAPGGTEELIAAVQTDGLCGLDAQTARDVAVYLPSLFLVKMDMATMAHSLEARSPFLDHRLAEYLAALPANYRLRRGQTKSLLRDAYRDCLPREVIAGRKRGFEIPLKSWLETELRELLHDTAGSRTARVRDYLDDDFLDALLAGDILRERNWATITYSILVLELWLRRFAEIEAVHPPYRAAAA